MDAPSKLICVTTNQDIDELPETRFMSSVFDKRPMITLPILKHLLDGGPVVDLTDEEYIHWLQLDSEALEYVQNKLLNH